MTNSMLDKTVHLRAEAWEYVKASEAFASFKALNDAVVAMGGADLIPSLDDEPKGVRINGKGGVSFSPITRALMERRVSQGDAAEAALKEKQEPSAAPELMVAAREKGASIGGEKPMVSFTSTLSKDPRFYSFRRMGGYFWWLRDIPLPPKWNESEPVDFDDLLGSDSSVSSGSEGGDGHGPATT